MQLLGAVLHLSELLCASLQEESWDVLAALQVLYNGCRFVLRFTVFVFSLIYGR